MKTNRPLIAALTVCASLTLNAGTPEGWFAAGSHPHQYEMTSDQTVTHGGKASASLKSTVKDAGGFGTLMQEMDAKAYRGKRLRMSSYARAADVADWAGFWMRVDGPNGKMLGFDNMQGRPIKGTSDWKRYEIVLDVPEPSEQIAFGILLSGTGQVWMDDVEFETVGKDVPTTGANPKAPSSGPRNLDFES